MSASTQPDGGLLAKAASLATNPIVLAALLAVIKFRPDLLKQIPGLNITGRGVTLSTSIASTLLGISILRRLNAYYNKRATNHWESTSRTRWSWPEEVAVVTGGSGGIGKCIVQDLAAQGIKVAVLDIVPLHKDLEDLSNVKLFHCDVASYEAVAAAATQVQQDLGHPTILVNNAGIGGLHTIIDTSDEFLRKIFGVNILSHWYATRCFLPEMIRQNKGHVVTIASTASFVTLAGTVDYAAAKAGLLSFHEGLTGEIKHVYKAPGVKTTIVHPNWALTPLVASHAAEIERSQGGRKLLRPEHVADVVVRQVLSGRGAQLIIPPGLSVVSTLKSWPNWLQELFRDRVGGHIARAFEANASKRSASTS